MRLPVAENRPRHFIRGTEFIDFHSRTVSPKHLCVPTTQGGSGGITDDVPKKEDLESTATVQDRHVCKEKSSSSAMNGFLFCLQIALKARTGPLANGLSDGS